MSGTVTLSPLDLSRVRLTDEELVEQVWSMIGKVADDVCSDRLYGLVSEILERFAPAIFLAQCKHEYQAEYLNDPEQVNTEFQSVYESFQRKDAARNVFRALYEERLDVRDPRVDLHKRRAAEREASPDA